MPLGVHNKMEAEVTGMKRHCETKTNIRVSFACKNVAVAL